MRRVVALGLLLIGARVACAQEQERKLIDRVLKPDMSLQNEAQNKQFTVAGATSMKAAQTKPLYVRERSPEMAFGATREIKTKSFATRSSSDERRPATVATRGGLGNLDATYETRSYHDTRGAYDAGKSVTGSEFSGTRPFLAHGKSQKSLSTENQPLTLEQVRALLNKNE